MFSQMLLVKQCRVPQTLFPVDCLVTEERDSVLYRTGAYGSQNVSDV